jgi:hypothetical protein
MAGEDRQDPRRGGLTRPCPALACPRCGAPNGCAPAASGSFGTPCWCTAVRVADAAREGVRDTPACLCRVCATAPR